MPLSQYYFGNPFRKMPRLDENTARQLSELENGARTRTMKAWDSFSNFALRDNVLEVAVGLM
jgi:large conductance mechanosensitive channel